MRNNKAALFLDRDGVVNTRLPGEYVRNWSEFTFCEGALEGIALLSDFFYKIVVVTNQAGIGKGLMTESDLSEIHRRMLAAIEKRGGRLDRIYHCPNVSADGAPCRKPDIGMGLQALNDFPDIHLAHSWILGDSLSDMEFGFRLGIRTALVTGKAEEAEKAARLVTDWRGDSLLEFARFIGAGT